MRQFSRLMRAAVPAFAVTVSGCGEDERSVAPYLPSSEVVVGELLELAEVGPDDFVIDLGSGDGRIVIAAAKRYGASGLGVEIDPRLVALAEANARQQGVAEQVRFVEQDLFETDLAPATVVTMYLLPDVVNRLKDKLVRELAPGSRVVSHEFGIDGWHAAEARGPSFEAQGAGGVSRSHLFLYVVPARLDGRWRVSLPAHAALDDLTLELEQDVTLLRGRAVTDGTGYDLIAVPLKGRELEFRVPRLEAVFSGRIEEEAIEGVATIGEQRGPWRAVREETRADAGPR